jgi:ubiquitin C-terminal hydrolase
MAHIVGGGQNDAVEFLMCILDYLHDSHSQPIDINIPEEVLKLSDAELDMLSLGKRIRYGLLRDINTRYAKEHTTFNKELYFYILNMVCCAKCEHISLNYNPYNILCLSLNNTSNGQTIYDCMDKMFSQEVLDCEYKCEKCKNPTGNTIEKKILTRPKTLIICLKRFEYHNPLFGPMKINSSVTYPLMLDISKYYPLEESEPANNLYKLTCVVNHIGRVNYGHYYSYCYDAERECWFNFNDDLVSIIPPDIVLNNSNAYILFYQKVRA